MAATRMVASVSAGPPSQEAFNMAFGEHLQELMTARGMSSTQLAAAAGLSWHTVHSYELGRREPKMSTLLSLADALGITIDDLVRPAAKKATGSG